MNPCSSSQSELKLGPVLARQEQGQKAQREGTPRPENSAEALLGCGPRFLHLSSITCERSCLNLKTQLLHPKLFFFFFLATSMAYGSAGARGRIPARALTYITAAAAPEPSPVVPGRDQTGDKLGP